ncbi:MAG TPA: CHAT domain-containing protein [Anaerolineales bacterium]|nr:CHAT domain-containing protein [Anaerolineales bacterium]
MKTIKVLGQSDDRLKSVDYGKELENFSVSDAVQMAADRSSANYHYISDLKDDDIVELIFEDNIRRWVTVSELEKDYKYSLSRGEKEGVIEIPPQLPTVVSQPQVSSRGATAWALKALRVIKFDPVKKAASTIAETWDEKLMPEPGLYRFNEAIAKRGDVLDNPRVDTGKPILLFLHGTFSSTLGSFGGLPKETWTRLCQHYGDQIFGYDHRTLSESPIRNALDLVRLLPENAVLHLVTHSRGGLIGELLSRRGRTDGRDAFDETDLKLASQHIQGTAGEQDLVMLTNLLNSKNIRVERFVRIACPARGTTIASGRLDRWLELIVNVLAKVLDPATGSLFGVLTDLLLDLKKQAANPEAIPGIAAMVPESGFIRMINRPDVEVDTDLYVIAGDVEKNDVLGRLAIFFTDLFYFEDHDLVVQTRAMYGGASRSNGLYFFQKGTDVNHFHYFSRRKTAEKIAEALTSNAAELQAKGFRQLAEAYRGEAIAEIDLVARSYQKRSNLDQPVVYVLPGIMGTHLSEGETRIWLHLLELARGKILNLQISNRNIRPHSLVAMSYGNLVDYLSATHEVIPFPYDWRPSILEEAERFGKVLEAKLEETKQPIRIVAHSMGGLVTRAMISLRPDIWEKICERDGSRFLMLGTPNLGAHKILRLILGQEKTLRTLAMLDIKNSALRLLEVIIRFPGVLQILPMDDPLWNFLDENTWNKFPSTGKYAWVKPLQKDLDEAKKFQAILKARKITEQDPIVYLAGNAPGAPVAVDLADNGEVIFRGTNEGDGTVTWRSGILPELKNRTWYMSAAHGDMPNHRESFPAIYDLLQKGKTARLSTVPPPVARGAEDTYVLTEKPVEIYPAQIDLEQIVLGAAPTPLAAPSGQPVRVTVAHGNLSFCNDPVAVGHYEGDALYNAEKALDYHLNGRLSARHRLGLYPGPEGTAEVVLNDPGQKPGGAIIVGLGKAGELSPRKLTQSFANAMREYGLKAAENNLLGEEGNLAVSTLLIGAGGTGLSVSNSVDAILSGVEQANKSFAQVEDALQRVRITEIQFIELFKDQAILAARALRTHANKPEFAVDPLLRSLRGGFQRLAYEEPAGWWRRIHVRAGKDDSLIFTVPTDRARSEESQQGVQKSNIDGLVSQAVGNPQWDQSLAIAMFELMIPNRLKGAFRDLNNILFVLDPGTAHYPWELIYDRRIGQDRPLVVQVGMIRQFSTSTFQERVVDVQNKNILVVGNPANTSADFTDLPGAQQEASLVAAKFTEFGYNVVPEIYTGSNSIMNSLFSNDYRVLHLAGHGVYRYPVKQPDGEETRIYTGMVLGNDIFLTANEIRNKTDIPELVFINCCHLGKLDSTNGAAGYEFNKLAASLAQELIEMGVKAVIAAGWAVDDSAALTFADVFYDELLKGATFGDAVKEARIETYELHKDRTNTWAAYQCYGDPAYRLVVMRDGARQGADSFVDIEEAVVEIKKLSGSAKTTSAAGIAALREGLVSLQRKIEDECPAWLEDSRLQEALGEAFAEMFLFDRAIKYYELALKNENCGASIKAIEQLANLSIRLAVTAFEADPDQYEKSRSLIEAQIKTLKSLIKTLGGTPERWSMVGSGYKRLARISSENSPDVCDLALKNMESAYKQAWDLAATKTPYPLTNHLTAKIARLLRANDPDETQKAFPLLADLARESARLAELEKLHAPDDFWAGIGGTDANLVGHLVDYVQSGSNGFGEELLEDLIKDYTTIWRRYGSARELNSVIENYAFLAAVLKATERHKDLSDFLLRISSSLNSISE